jgi:hypothetical protein
MCISVDNFNVHMAGFTILGHTVEPCRLRYIDPDVMSLHDVPASSSSHTSRL